MRILFSALVASLALTPATFAQGSIWDGVISLFEEAREPVPPGHTLKKVAQLTSDRDSEVTHLSVLVDGEGRMAGLYAANQAPAYDPTDPWEIQNSPVARNIFWLTEIESASGVVLAEVQGRKALILKGKLARDTQEGKFTIRYLANGLWNTYESCDFHLRRKPNGWYLQNAYTGGTIRTVKVLTYSLGIETLEGLCPAK